ncbi:MAG: hypothetical protein AAF206_22030, partial [Bacteroidota bacterium]
MRAFRQKVIPHLIVLLCSLIVLWIFYGEILLSPNQYWFHDEGDGVKNYFTLAWHVKHDVSALDFEGMNYPFGEHVLYTDGHPALGWILRLLPVEIPPIGLINLLMLLSMPLLAVVLFGILRKHGLPDWFAGLATLAIMMLQPQLFRMTAHYSLAYAFAFPLNWWIWWRFHEAERKYLWSGILAGVLLFWLFIHPYLGMMSIFFVGAAFLVEWPVKERPWGRIGHLILQCAFPILFLLLFLKLTDTH